MSDMTRGLKGDLLLTTGSSGDVICADATLAESENKNNNDRLRLFLFQGLCRCGHEYSVSDGLPQKKKPLHTLCIGHSFVQKGMAL
jgi:hypothetical protein